MYDIKLFYCNGFRYPLFKWPLIFLILVVVSGCTESEPTLKVEKVEVIEVDFPPEPGKTYPASRINRPYFDEKNQLQWNNDKKIPVYVELLHNLSVGIK
ncbi:MAG: hypothetical protein KAH84_11740 [Thiomargarita sp.]|nr:hypothetical protein [Thiomargarita sp.]